MTNGLRIVRTRLSNGEVVPQLIDALGCPSFYPTVWSMAVLRRRSAATMEQGLRGAMMLHRFCITRSIDLTNRIATSAGTILTPSELLDLVDRAMRPAEDLTSPVPAKQRAPSPNSARLFRAMPAPASIRVVRNGTARIRLHYLTAYLRWRGENQLPRIQDRELAREYRFNLDAVLGHLHAALPTGKAGGTVESLTPDQMALALAVTDPAHPDNPWMDCFVRARNFLIVRWLLATGMRRGELLGLQLRDFDRRLMALRIVRRQDNPADPRRRPPNQKTLSRINPLSEDMTKIGEAYLDRRKELLKAAGRKDRGFLVVASDGAPLSDSSVTEIFVDIRNAHPGVGPLTAHVLRHQWNEEFSRTADAKGLDPDAEARERRELMGWSARSAMPAHYLRRKTRADAAKTSLETQKRLMDLGRKARPLSSLDISEADNRHD